MGAGKTTVGRLLARQIGYGFIDLDATIEKVAGDKPITQLFAQQGEEAFRQLESQVLAQVCAHTNLAIATGGGIILRRENWSYLHHGLIVWLDVSVELLHTRLAEDKTRPLLQDTDQLRKLQTLLKQRQPLYAQADLRVAINKEETPEQTATKIIEELPKILKTK